MSAIGIRVEFDDGDIRESFPDFGEFAQEFLGEVPSMSRGIEAELQKSVDIHLASAEPPEWHTRQQRFIWSHDPYKQKKARAYWFAYLKETNQFDPKGGFYQRTGKLRKSWRAQASSSIRANDATITVEITNTSPDSSYVYGAVETGWERVPSHAVTGWIRGDGPEMDTVIDDAYQIIVDQMTIAGEKHDI